VTVATRADVAKLAAVSESTVSYVISGKRPISEPTRKRVLAAIKETGYKSNYAASALAGGSPRLVTMMISSLFTTPSSRINGALVDGIVDGVRESGFHSVIWPVSNDDDADVDLLIRSNFSGGVILMNVKENDQRLHLLNRDKIPFVVLGRTEVGFEYNYVDRDFQAVDRIALTKLKELGHSRIGVLISGRSIPEHLNKEASKLKLRLQPLDAPNTIEGGAELAFSFKKEFPTVTGIISLLDAATLGFMNASKAAGISIPKELSIIGVNMLESQAISTKPATSTVAFDAYEMAKSCGRIMVATIDAGKNSKKKKVSELWIGDFMDRDSTAKVRES
jgi:DNA-binding LacI/PurR family transcriptional regulator